MVHIFYLTDLIVMKRTFLKATSMALAFLMLSTQSLFASSKELIVTTEDMNFDVAGFEAEFAALDQLEKLVKEEGITSFAELESKESVSLDLTDFKSTNSITATQGFDWDNFDWPSGLWGFLCCPIGFFVVITNKDKTKDQKISFWIGVAASTVLSALTTPLYYSSY